MNIKDFNEALYASSNGVVVERRKATLLPLLTLLAGIALLVVNAFVADTMEMNNLKSALILFGGLITIVGVAYTAVGVFGGGAPYHTGDRCFLERKLYSFDHAQRKAVVDAIEKGSKATLDTLQESDIASISVVCYTSPKSNYCVMQAFAYEGLDYDSICAMKVTM